MEYSKIKNDLISDLKEKQNQLNFGNLTFPIKCEENVICKFETLNPGIHINVYGYDESEVSVYPLRINKKGTH